MNVKYGEKVSYDEGQWVAVIYEYASHSTATVWQADDDGQLVEKENVLQGNDPDGIPVYRDERVKAFDSKEEAVTYCENANCDTVDVQD